MTMSAAAAKPRAETVSEVIGKLMADRQEWLADMLVDVRDDLVELDRMVPDLDGVMSHNPISQVYFRAGLLACREYMARFVEQGGDSTTAASIRANWWPSLGDDPGPPRRLRFDECAIEREDGKVDVVDIPPSIEALARADAFLTHNTIPRFAEVSCSQCGKNFGPGDHGFSHCKDHEGKSGIRA
jgi:hypothetical protein